MNVIFSYRGSVLKELSCRTIDIDDCGDMFCDGKKVAHLDREDGKWWVYGGKPDQLFCYATDVSIRMD